MDRNQPARGHHDCCNFVIDFCAAKFRICSIFSVWGRGKGRKRLSRWRGGVEFIENRGVISEEEVGGGSPRRLGGGSTGAARMSARRGG